MMYSSPKRARGAALIIALMVVALVAVIGASMSIDYLITVKRASNQLIGEQAYSYGIAAEKFAVKALQMDLLMDMQEGGNRHDSLDEFWAKDAPPFQTEEGAYGGKLIDLSGRFNINLLKDERSGFNDVQKGSSLPMTVNEARFTRLLMSLSDEEGDFVVQSEQANAIMAAVVDWLDVDNAVTGVDGAEDDFYAGIEGRPPYRAANREMVSPSELLLVAHMTPEIYKRLLPHVSVWPMRPDRVPSTGGAGGGAGATTTETGGININTATENVLRSLNVPAGAQSGQPGTAGLDGFPMSREMVAPILQQQAEEGGFRDVKEFMAMYKDPSVPQVDSAGLGTTSDFFLLDGHVTIGDVATHMQSVISRKDENVLIIVRSSGGL